MRHIARVYRLVLYTLVGALVALALLSGAARLLLHSLDHFRAPLEQWVGTALGARVRIGAVEAGLRGGSAGLLLREVALSAADGGEIGRFAGLRLGLDLYGSLRAGQPLFDVVVLSGAAVVVERTAAGALRVQGLSGGGEDTGGAAAVGAWLLAQPRLKLEDGSLLWRDPASGRERLFHDVDLELTNDGDHHRLAGRLVRGGGATVRVGAEVTGNLFGAGPWSARSFLRGAHIDVAEWLEPIADLPLRPGGGRLDFALWGDWRDGRLERLAGRAALGALTFPGEPLAPVSVAVERLLLRPQADGWLLDLGEVELAQGDVRGTVGRVQVLRRGNGLELRTPALPLAPLARLAAGLPGIEQPVRATLAQLAPDGDLSDLLLARGDDGTLVLQTRFDNLRLAAHDRFPGVEGLDGRLRLGPDGADLILDTRDGALDLPRLFRGPLPVGRLTGVVTARPAAQGWSVAGQALEVENADLRAGAEFALRLTPDRAPFLDLRGHIDSARAVAVPRYLPARIMPPDSVQWLDAAFGAGSARSGHILFHGFTDQFPFSGHEGRFAIEFAAEGVDLHYRAGWPDLKGTAGRVLFDGPGMTIDARAARVRGGRVGATRVAIADLHEPVLTVQGQAALPGADVLALLHDGDLGRLAPDLSALTAGGDTELELELTVPLARRLADSHPLRASGRLRLRDTWLRLGEQVTIYGADGSVQFDNARLRADGLSALMFGAPVTIDIRQAAQEGRHDTLIAARGRARGAALHRELGLAPLRYLEGESDWQATVTFRDGEEGTLLHARSSLVGMAVRLPAPLGKGEQAQVPLDLRLELSGPRRGRLRIGYGERLQAALQLTEADSRIARGAVHFGIAPPPLPAAPVLILSGVLEPFPLAEWSGEVAGEGGGDGREPLVAIPVELRLERLHLVSTADDARPRRAAAPSAAVLPPLTAAIDHLRYDDMDLGSVSFRLRPRSDGLLLEELAAGSDAFRLSGDGRWRRDERAQETRLRLELTADDTGHMAQAMGFATVITGGRLRVDGELHWPVAPTDLTLATLGGQVHGEIKDGRIEDVNPGTGRLLGLFSLRAIPKRLSLDFRDFFNKGLTFDTLEGDFRIEHGDALTDDLRLDAPSTQVLTVGRTGLAARDYDLEMTVVPNLSDSLTVAGGLALGPQVGAALLLLHKVLKLPTDKASAIRYRVTGSWEEPQVRRAASREGEWGE